MIRRLKTDVLDELPNKIRQVFPIEVETNKNRDDDMKRLLEILKINRTDLTTEEYTSLDLKLFSHSLN